MTEDPFLVLDVGPNADDDEIKRHYLALVRKFSPERDAQRFQEVRAAYEAIRDRRGRLRTRVFDTGSGALTRLKRSLLESPVIGIGRASRSTVNDVLLEGLHVTDAVSKQ